MGQHELGDGAQTPTTAAAVSQTRTTAPAASQTRTTAAAASHTRMERPLAIDESHRRVDVLLACLDRLRELIAFLVFI